MEVSFTASGLHNHTRFDDGYMPEKDHARHVLCDWWEIINTFLGLVLCLNASHLSIITTKGGWGCLNVSPLS